jgi:LacI family transcriptional regulator
MPAMNILAADDLGPVALGRRPTINDVARLAGVSKKTVSRVINDEAPVKPETRARVKAVIAETGYVPDPQARALAFGRPCLLGLIYETWMAPSLMTMPLGILRELRGTGVEMVIHPCGVNRPDFLDDLRSFVSRQRLVGVILTSPVCDHAPVLALLDEMNCPYVRVGAGGANGSAAMIDTMDDYGGRLAAEHLIDLGHVRFAYVAGAYGNASQARLRGFRSALAERGLQLPDDCIVDAGFGFEKGLIAGEAVLAMTPRPTAVFADTDELAAGVLRMAADRGVRAPQDLSVIGYGDFRIAPVVSLTTIRSTTWHVGALAVQRLINGPDAGAELPPPSLIVRTSTGRAPV